MKRILFLLCMLTHLCAQDEFSASLKSSASEISLDDQVTLTLTLTYPRGYQPHLPEVHRWLWQQIAFVQPPFKLVSEHSDPAVDTSNGILQQWFQFVLEPWQTGAHRLSFGPIAFKKAQQDDIYVLPNTVLIDVTAPTQIVLQPAKAMIITRTPQLELDAINQQRLAEEMLQQAALNRQWMENHSFPWHYLVGYIALLTLGTAAALLYWQSRRATPVVATPPQPAATALAKIAKLAKQIPKTTEQHHTFFVELSTVVRVYLEQITGIRAPEQTTPEFLEALTKNPQLKGQDRQLIADLLIQADLVKFAAQETTPERCKSAIKAAIDLIARTG